VTKYIMGKYNGSRWCTYQANRLPCGQYSWPLRNEAKHPAWWGREGSHAHACL